MPLTQISREAHHPPGLPFLTSAAHPAPFLGRRLAAQTLEGGGPVTVGGSRRHAVSIFLSHREG